MSDNRLVQALKRVWTVYDRMMEKQGFYIVLGVCILTIALSAFYTFRLRRADDSQLMTQEEALDVGGAQDSQSLAQALVASQRAPLLVPTQTPFSFAQPLEGFTTRLFNDVEPQYFQHGDVWKLHMGIDIETDYGTAVSACEGGLVAAVWRDNELGLCVRIDHQNGYESLYAGMDSAAYVQAGDPVAKGQTIGHSGNGVLWEGDAPPHLHLQIIKNGKAVDPLLVFLGIDN